MIRCDRAHPFYNGDRNENLDKLKEILLTYMMYDFDTGYVQGMSDLVSPLLYVAEGDTCKAFWFFVQTMEFTVSYKKICLYFMIIDVGIIYRTIILKCHS